MRLKMASASFQAVMATMPRSPLMQQMPDLQRMGGANDDPLASVGKAGPFVDGGKIRSKPHAVWFACGLLLRYICLRVVCFLFSQCTCSYTRIVVECEGTILFSASMSCGRRAAAAVAGVESGGLHLTMTSAFYKCNVSAQYCLPERQAPGQCPSPIRSATSRGSI